MPASRPARDSDENFSLPDAQEQLSLRQLRHHVGNTWQRLLFEVTIAAESGGNAEVRRLARQLEARITAVVGVADAMFGFTQAPGPMQARLESLCRHAIAAQAGSAQAIALETWLEGPCPPHLAETVLRVAQEMVTNAVKHGMHDREHGRILVSLTMRPGGGTRLSVSDDGWGPGMGSRPGEGMAVMRSLAEEAGGGITLMRDGAMTVARLDLP